jgi:hypothetical protein
VTGGSTDTGDSAEDAERYKHLPEPVRIEHTVASQETRPARDPEDGRDTNRDFMIRYAG